MSLLACGEHPHHLGVGVCASCVSEKLVLCISNLRREEDKEEEERDQKEELGDEDGVGSGDRSSDASDINKSSALNERANGLDHGNGGSASCPQGYYAHAGGRPLSWLSAKLFFKKRVLLHRKPNCIHDDIALRSPPASLTWQTPRPSCSTSSARSPLKLASAHTPSSTSQPKIKSPLFLGTSDIPTTSNSPLQLPPPVTSPFPASRSPFSLPPSLHLRSAPQPTIASLSTSSAHLAHSAEEANRGRGLPEVSGSAVHTKRKASWASIVLGKLRTFGFKRRVQHQEIIEEMEAVDSNRTSSATESDFLRNSHYKSCVDQARHSRSNSYSNLQFSAFSNYRPQSRRESDRKSVGGYANYYHSSPAVSNFSALQTRQQYRYKSMSCVQRRDTAEFLKFYLPPPTFYSNLTGSYYY